MQIPLTERLLAVDVGNSRIKFGLFDLAEIRGNESLLPHCYESLAVPLNSPLPWERISQWMDPSGSGAAPGIMAGANPRGIERVKTTWPEWLERAPMIVDNTKRVPLEVRVEFPARVGIDRLLNAVAANLVRPPQRSAIVVSTGTATTIDFVATDGAFEGGAILPGFELAARSLHRYTALLPLIPIEELASSVPDVLGKNTRLAVRSGLYWGQLGAVKELIARLTEDAHKRTDPVHNGDPSSAAEQPLILLTGGGALLLKDHLPPEVRWEPNLALQGLAVVATRYIE